MKMIDWIDKIDQFLQISEKKILTNAGSISTETAAKKASLEFDIYRKTRMNEMVSDFDKAIKTIQADKQKNQRKVRKSKS